MEFDLLASLRTGFDAALQHLPSLLGIVIVLALLWGLRWVLLVRQGGGKAEHRFTRLLSMLFATCAALLLVVLMLPIAESTRSQLLGLFGVALTAMIAIASTSFVANIMAGLMLRIVKSYRPGDFLRVEGHFGRVSDRGLFHTEIQTEDGDLTTLPNLYISSHPVTVVRSSGTIISATVSLGYDVDHGLVDELLCAAASACALRDPFVQIKELGDYSVSYRVAGVLEEVNTLLTARSRLRSAMLDALHGGGIEIVSPTFMNQRVLTPDQRFIASAPQDGRGPGVGPTPEEIMFDKAAEAEKLEALRDQLRRLAERRDEIGKLAKDAGEDDRQRRDAQLAAVDRRIALLERAVEGAST